MFKDRQTTEPTLFLVLKTLESWVLFLIHDVTAIIQFFEGSLYKIPSTKKGKNSES